MSTSLSKLLEQVRACTLCAPHLPPGPRPVLQADQRATILIAGQAPGRRVHETGIPFDDPSGERLRDWMGIGHDVFYDASRIAILPMGFCYPGSGESGDLPPRQECAPAWRDAVLSHMTSIRLTLVLGSYAHRHHLGASAGVTEVVRDWRRYWPDLLPLPHPSPRNRIWLRRNAWFETDVITALRERVAELI